MSDQSEEKIQNSKASSETTRSKKSSDNGVLFSFKKRKAQENNAEANNGIIEV